MEVDTGVERVIPSQNVKTVINPNLPSLNQLMEIDGSIDLRKKIYVYPEPSDINNLGPIDFVIHETPGYYLDLGSITVDAKIHLLNDRGAREDIGNWNSYFINNLSQTLWSTIKVSLNNTNIESNYYNQQLANLHHILSTPNIIVKERGAVQGAFPVETDTLKDTLDADHMGVASIVDRVTFAKQNVIHLTAPLQLDLSSATKYLSDGINVKITLEPSSPLFLIKRSNAAGDGRINHKFAIDNIRLLVNKIKPSDGVLISESKRLMNKPFEYIIRRNLVKETVFPAGQSELSISRPFQAVIPNKLYIFMVTQSAARGSYHRHPFFYAPNNLLSYSVKLDGLEIAGHETSDGFVQTYVESLRAHGEDYFIPYAIFKKSCFVICVDTNQGSDLNTLAVERRGNLQLTLHMGGALAESLLVYVVGAVDSTFEIDANKSVTTLYQY